MSDLAMDVEETEAQFSELRNRNMSLQQKVEKQQQTVFVLGLTTGAFLLLTVLVFVMSHWQKLRISRDLSRIDDLTQAPNRIACFRSAKLAFDQASVGHYSTVIAAVDLDDFKRVNSDFGHHAGDQVLRLFAQSLNKVLREQDSFGRIGGAEWLLVCPRANLNDIQHIFERLRGEYQYAVSSIVGDQYRVTFSMGAVSTLAAYGKVEDMISDSEKLVYIAKSNGKDRLEVDNTN